MNVRKRVRESMSDYVSQKNEGSEHYRLDDAHKEWMAENPDIFSAYQEEAARLGTKRLLKDVIDAHTIQTKIRKGHAEQLELAGLARLPCAYAIPDESGEGNVYVPAMQMTIPLFDRHRKILEGNIAFAAKRLDDFDRMIDQLRPWMQADDQTLAEALDAMEKDEVRSGRTKWRVDQLEEMHGPYHDEVDQG